MLNVVVAESARELELGMTKLPVLAWNWKLQRSQFPSTALTNVVIMDVLFASRTV